MNIMAQVSLKSNISEKIESWGDSVGIKLKIPQRACNRYSKVQTDIWNHIMKHSLPKHEISSLNKNVLLHHLEQRKNIHVTTSLKSRKDLDNYELYNNLQALHETKIKILKNLKETCEKQKKEIIVTAKSKNITRESIKAVRKKNTLMKIYLKRIVKLLKENKDNLDYADVSRSILSDRVVDPNRLINGDGEEIRFENFLTDIEALYHSDDLGGENADLTSENNSLWDKINDFILVSPPELYATVIQNLKENNTELDEFLKTCIRNSHERSVPVTLMDDIRYLHIKLFLSNDKLKKSVENLKRDLHAVKNEICLSASEKLPYSICEEDESERYKNMIENFVNGKCAGIIKEEVNTFLKTKIEEVKDDTQQLEFHKATLNGLMKKLLSLNEKLEEKSKILSKYNAVVLNEKYEQNNNFSRTYVNEFIRKFQQLNLVVNGNSQDNIVSVLAGGGGGGGDASSGISSAYGSESSFNSYNSSNNILMQMEGFIKNETERFVNTSAEKIFHQLKTSVKNLEQSCFTDKSSDLYLPYDVLVGKEWTEVLKNIKIDMNDFSMSTSFDTGDLMETMKEQEIECEHRLADNKGNINSNLNSAMEAFDKATECGFLLEESGSSMINNILITNEIMNKDSEIGQSFQSVIEKFKEH